MFLPSHDTPTDSDPTSTSIASTPGVVNSPHTAPSPLPLLPFRAMSLDTLTNPVDSLKDNGDAYMTSLGHDHHVEGVYSDPAHHNVARSPRSVTPPGLSSPFPGKSTGVNEVNLRVHNPDPHPVGLGLTLDFTPGSGSNHAGSGSNNLKRRERLPQFGSRGIPLFPDFPVPVRLGQSNHESPSN